MKKIISFEKEIDFPSMIGDITSISLENSLKFIDKNNIEGKFFVSGTYKMTEASTLEEEFKYDIPIEIALTENFDLENVTVSIDDFHYEIINDDILKCNIDVLIDGIEELDINDIEVINDKTKEDIRECDGDKEEKTIEIPTKKEEIEEKEEQIQKLEVKNEIKQNTEIEGEIEMKNNEQEKAGEIEMKNNEQEKAENISSLFEALSTTEETYTTYSIYIIRKEDTIEKIMDKYNITKEELNDYNDLSNLEVGSKIIIPTSSVNE